MHTYVLQRVHICPEYSKSRLPAFKADLQADSGILATVHTVLVPPHSLLSATLASVCASASSPPSLFPVEQPAQCKPSSGVALVVEA